jgi:hypothetical protein
MYPDPLEFRPERFLGPSPQTDPRKFIFGFGGRRYPSAYHLPGTIQSSIEQWHLISGLHFAEASSYFNKYLYLLHCCCVHDSTTKI